MQLTCPTDLCQLDPKARLMRRSNHTYKGEVSGFGDACVMPAQADIQEHLNSWFPASVGKTKLDSRSPCPWGWHDLPRFPRVVIRLQAEAETLECSECFGKTQRDSAVIARTYPNWEYHSFMVMKIFGLADMLRDALKPLEKHVAAVFIYGAIAKHPDLAHNVADIMIIGQGLSSTDVIPHLIKAEKHIGCRINPSIYSVLELSRKLAGGNIFLFAVMKQPKIFLIGSENELPVLPDAVKTERTTHSGKAQK